MSLCSLGSLVRFQTEGLFMCKMHLALLWKCKVAAGGGVGISQDSTTSKLDEWGGFVLTFKGVCRVARGSALHIRMAALSRSLRCRS
jgi:hypothetical protein